MRCLAARGAKDGADVTPGEFLYQIDPRDSQAAFDQAKAQSRHDAAAYEYSLASQNRNLVLSKDDRVAKDTFDQTTSNLNQTEATLGVDSTAIQTAELRLGYTRIRASFSGRRGKSQVHEGAHPEQRFSGTLSFTGTITARATIGNPDRTLLPGEFVHVRVHIADRHGALLVPQVALGSSQLGRLLYAVGKDGKAEQRDRRRDWQRRRMRSGSSGCRIALMNSTQH
jgi:multidrug efflux system membrane fusion protein